LPLVACVKKGIYNIDFQSPRIDLNFKSSHDSLICFNDDDSLIVNELKLICQASSAETSPALNILKINFFVLLAVFSIWRVLLQVKSLEPKSNFNYY